MQNDKDKRISDLESQLAERDIALDEIKQRMAEYAARIEAFDKDLSNLRRTVPEFPTVAIFAFANCIEKIITDVPNLVCVLLDDDLDSLGGVGIAPEDMPLVLVPLPEGSDVWAYSFEKAQYDPNTVSHIVSSTGVSLADVLDALDALENNDQSQEP